MLANVQTWKQATLQAKLPLKLFQKWTNGACWETKAAKASKIFETWARQRGFQHPFDSKLQCYKIFTRWLMNFCHRNSILKNTTLRNHSKFCYIPIFTNPIRTSNENKSVKEKKIPYRQVKKETARKVKN